MGMNDTPSGERVHIGVFGRTNVGKSSLINAITGQELSIVSEVPGTTTDPVKKAMELLPLGPVVFIDTPGLDDDTELGKKRIEKAKEMLRQSEIVLLVVNATQEDLSFEKDFVSRCKEMKLSLVVAMNQADLLYTADIARQARLLKKELGITEDVLAVSAETGEGIYELKERLAHAKELGAGRPLVADLLKAGDFVVLVVPIDSAAPKGRLILPQQQVIRDCLEAGAIPVVCRESELTMALSGLAETPRIVITDSQAFGYVSKIVPQEIPLTSFSILMARYKGDLKTQVAGARAIDALQDGDTVLVSEGCTHHRQCSDIGTVKIPKWLEDYTGKKLQYEFTSGGTFPADLTSYALVVHCGGCTLGLQEMRYRIESGAKQNVPITNYGVMIAYIHGILDRVIAPFSI